MKTIFKVILVLTVSIVSTAGVNNGIISKVNVENNDDVLVLNTEEFIEEPKIVFDGLTMEELSSKIERNLNSDISGYGEVFATKSIELGIDPYLAVSIMLHETGCKWNCSSLMRKCNNVGGMKGSPGCNGGAYKRFNTLDEGIDAFLNNLYNNYYAKGYTTPEQIGARYAADPLWPSKINKYINEIRNS